ncbi:helix-turn-helix transcriptional regulator [Salipaludibacillus agaradhaerens]|nr:helix-turn-helix transcriptional regulator [Salipaludibacillus sp. LMS25]MCR6107864.1 helix-turn-helix transcriptional regulator [Salipaludibacillus agaradhaerens]MCR6119893.1 helix-turn-helix transcriptional regulator [Salipaludibacillus agaradhaerens]UTR16950.1 helix-turn-helix transcriptional regulator [Salipaludibacillus sp. LMS25]
MKNKMRELRKLKNLSQKSLSESLNVSRQTVISIENGKYDPSLKLGMKIADFFDSRVEEIFFLEE